MELKIYDLTTPSITIITNSSEGNNVTHLYWETYLWAFINIVLLICILGGNALTIIAVRTCRRLRSLISNMFICSLAISDFIVGLSLPYHLVFYLGSNWGHKYDLCLIRFYLVIFACSVSISTLIAISIDRYIAIVYPLHYRRYMTRRVAIFIIAITWSVGAIVAVVPMFWNNWNTAFQCEFDEVLPPWYMAGIITPAFAIIWILMFFMYWRIMKAAYKQANQLKLTRGKRKSNIIEADWRSIQVVIFIMGCFSICWLPYFTVACAQIFKIYKMNSLVYKAAFSLALTNSALNPIIYAWKNSNFRKAFILLLHCKTPNCYQISPGLSKDSPVSQKRIPNNGLRVANERYSLSSDNIRTDYLLENNVISGPDVEVDASSNTTLKIKSQSLPRNFMISISTALNRL